MTDSKVSVRLCGEFAWANAHHRDTKVHKGGTERKAEVNGNE